MVIRFSLNENFFFFPAYPRLLDQILARLEGSKAIERRDFVCALRAAACYSQGAKTLRPNGTTLTGLHSQKALCETTASEEDCMVFLFRPGPMVTLKVAKEILVPCTNGLI